MTHICDDIKTVQLLRNALKDMIEAHDYWMGKAVDAGAQSFAPYPNSASEARVLLAETSHYEMDVE